jgi:hypothetical protein
MPHTEILIPIRGEASFYIEVAGVARGKLPLPLGPGDFVRVFFADEQEPQVKVIRRPGDEPPPGLPAHFSNSVTVAVADPSSEAHRPPPPVRVAIEITECDLVVRTYEERRPPTERRYAPILNPPRAYTMVAPFSHPLAPGDRFSCVVSLIPDGGERADALAEQHERPSPGGTRQ